MVPSKAQCERRRGGNLNWHSAAGGHGRVASPHAPSFAGMRVLQRVLWRTPTAAHARVTCGPWVGRGVSDRETLTQQLRECMADLEQCRAQLAAERNKAEDGLSSVTSPNTAATCSFPAQRTSLVVPNGGLLCRQT